MQYILRLLELVVEKAVGVGKRRLPESDWKRLLESRAKIF
jgi:hypothetical protein